MSGGERRRFASSGGELAFTDIGEGPVVLLLHGLPLWSRQWQELTALLASRFRVLAPDLLGAGDSDMPAGVALHLDAQAGYVRELLRSLDIDRFAVVGHSTGGGVAQTLALDGAGVEAMVLLDSAIEAPARIAAQVGTELATRMTSPGGVDDVFRALLDLGARRHARITDDLIEAYARPYRDDPSALVRALEAVGAGWVGREAELGHIEFPVLILWGEEDPFASVASAEALNDAMPSSTLGLLPGCGHFIDIEAIDTIGPMIAEYLRARWLRAPHGHADRSGVVMLQLERRPPWVDLAEAEADPWFDEGGPEPELPDPSDQEVGRGSGS